jgi:hypothetical protein
MSGYLARLVARAIPQGVVLPVSPPGAPEERRTELEDPFEATAMDSPPEIPVSPSEASPQGEKSGLRQEPTASVVGEVPAIPAGPRPPSPSPLARAGSTPAQEVKSAAPMSEACPRRPSIEHDRAGQPVRPADDREGEAARETPAAVAEAGREATLRQPPAPMPAGGEEQAANALEMADRFMAQVMPHRANAPGPAPALRPPGEVSERPHRPRGKMTPLLPAATAAVAPASSTEASPPTLVVGRIDVEVVAPSAPPIPAPTRVVVYAPAETTPAGPPSALHFGLGQV